MSNPFNVQDLNTVSALQLTLWPAQPELRDLAAKALTAFGRVEQSENLYLLGLDFLRYLQFESAALESTNYPSLAGFQITHAVLSKCGAAGRAIDKRSARILSAERNGPILRGFGDADHPQEVTAVFSHLTSDRWRQLAIALGWDPHDLRSADAPGIAFYPKADPEMTLLSPPYWT